MSAKPNEKLILNEKQILLKRTQDALNLNPHQQYVEISGQIVSRSFARRLERVLQHGR